MDMARIRQTLAAARQAIDDADAALDAAGMLPPPSSPLSRRYVPPARRQTDVSQQSIVALADAPDWIGTAPLARFWGCHVNAVLYYIKRGRLEARKDGKRHLVTKASAMALDAVIRAYRNRDRTPPAA